MMPKVFVVVPTYNGAQFIAGAIRSILCQVDTPSAIIVVDNGSTDTTLAIVAREFPLVRVYQLSVNRGFGQAANVGIQSALDAAAEFVFLMNQDVVAEEEALAILVEEMEADPGLGLVSGLQMTYDGHHVDPTFRQYAGTQFWDDLVLGTPRSCYRVAYMPAAAVMVRNQALTNLQGFDPLFFMYGEDDDFCRRLAAAGWSVGFAPKALVRHWHGLLNARRSWRWQLNWEYSRASLHLRWSPRRLPLAFLSLLWNWIVPPGFSISQLAVKPLAFLKCLARIKSIRRHKQVAVRSSIADGRFPGRMRARSTLPVCASDHR